MLPYQIQNGADLDADKVMANFEYLDGVSGWFSTSETVTYSAAQQIVVSSAFAAMLGKGAKLRLFNDGAYKFFFVKTVTGTTINLAGAVNLVSGDIANVGFSYADQPQGFPEWPIAKMQNASQSIGNAAFTNVDLTTSVFSTNGIQVDTTNKQINILISGYYSLHVAMTYPDSANGGTRYVCAKVNNTTSYADTFHPKDGGNRWKVSQCDVTYLNKGDYVKMQTHQDSGGSVTIVAGSHRLSVALITV